MFFAYWELRLKRQLTDDALHPRGTFGDFEILTDFSERAKRERILRGLPKRALFKFRMVVRLKFLFAAIFIVEVILLQKPW